MNRPTVLRSALRVAAAYMLFAGVWIIGSDWALLQVVTEPEALQAAQTYKGIAFVVVSGLLLFFMLLGEHRALAEARSEAARSSEAFEATFQHAPVAIGHVTADGRWMQVNRPLADLFGATPGSLRDQSVVSCFRRVTDPLAVDGLARLFQGESRGMQAQFRIEGETDRWINLSLRRSRDPEGETYFICIAEDVTQLREALEAAAAARERYWTLFDRNPYPMWFYDMDSLAIVEVNSAAVGHYGYSREEFRRLSILDIRPEEEHGRLREHMATLTGESDSGGWRHRRKDGSLIDVQIASVPVELDGRPARLVVINDVTEKRRAQSELANTTRLLESTFESLHDALFIVDRRDHSIVRCNRAVEAVFGYRPEEVVGQTTRIFHLDDEHSESFNRRSREALAKGGGFIGEYQLRRKDGSIMESEHSIRYIQGMGGEQLSVSIVRDITQRKRAEKRLGTMTERLRKVSRSLLEAQESERRFISQELHDQVGQELTSLRLQLLMLEQEGVAQDDSMGSMLEAVDRVMSQVRDISVALRPAILDDLGLGPALQWLVRRQAEGAGFEVELDLGEPLDLPSELSTAAFRIVQESVTNVARYAQARNVKVTVHRDQEGLRVLVEDDGRGFDTDQVRDRGLTGESYGVRGMRERAELLGGNFDIQSSPEGGTRVSARIPLE